MKDQRKYKVTLFLAVWQANFFGVAYGMWLADGAKAATPLQAGMVMALWFMMSHVVWSRARRVFWPEDFEKGGK